MFTPSNAPLVTEQSQQDFLPEELVLPEAFVEGNVLVINGKPYPIGDAFYDAEGIPLGATVRDRTGLCGYAPIRKLPDHVLLWHLDGSGRKAYIVTTADDPLIPGPTGFNQMIENLQLAEDRLANTAKGGAGALATAIVLQFAVCPHTVGTTCVSAVLTFLVGAVGATIWGGTQLLSEIIPAMNNVESAFATIDQNRR